MRPGCRRTAGPLATHSGRRGPISPLLAPLVVVLLVGMLLVGVAGLGVLGTVRPALAGTNTVVVTATGLAPARLAMPVGSELVVRNDSDQPVQVTASTANWTYARLLPAGMSSEPYRFDAPGEYGYDVTFRPLTASAHPPLQGRVVIGAAASPATSSGAGVPPAPGSLPGSPPGTPAPDPSPPASATAPPGPSTPSASQVASASGPAPSASGPADAAGSTAAANTPGSSAGSPTGGRGTTSLTGGLGGVPSGGFTLTDPPPLVATPPPVVAQDPAVEPLSAVRPGGGPIRSGPLPGAPSSRGRGLGLLVAATLVLGVGSGVVRVVLAVPPRR